MSGSGNWLTIVDMPGYDFRKGQPIARHGHPRQTDRSRLALAERLRRKTDRIGPTRVRRPCDRLGRGALTQDSASLCRLLQRSENAPIVGQRRTILAPGSADRKHHVTCAPRRTASPLHANLSFRYTQAIGPRPAAWLVALGLPAPRSRLGQTRRIGDVRDRSA
jgi:hypothetical protein